MKLILLHKYIAIALLGLLIGKIPTQAQNIAKGRSSLKTQAYDQAYEYFSMETKLKPQDPEARVLAGLANILAIAKSQSFNRFLDRSGFNKEGRNLGDWTADIDSEALEKRLKTEKMNGQELAKFIQDDLIVNLENTLIHLKAIPSDKTYLVFLSEEETQISDVFLDQGDTSMVQALIELFLFILYGFNAQDMNVDIQSILDLLDDKISVDLFLKINPSFLKDVSTEKIKSSRKAFVSSIDQYQLGSKRLKNRSTKKLNHLISIDEDQEDLEADFQENLSTLRFEESLNSLFQIEVKESNINVRADPIRLFETPLRNLTRVDGLSTLIHQEAERMETQISKDLSKITSIARPRNVHPYILTEDKSDGADILNLQGYLQLIHGLSTFLSAHNLDMGAGEITKLSDQEKLNLQNILGTNRNLLRLIDSKNMTQAKDLFSNANINLRKGYNLYLSRNNDQIGLFSPEEDLLDEILESLEIILSTNPKPYALSDSFEEAEYLIDPSPLWRGKADIRSLLPRFVANDPVPGNLPNPKLSGIFPEGLYVNAESKFSIKEAIISPVRINNLELLKSGYLKITGEAPKGSNVTIESTTDLRQWKNIFSVPATTGQFNLNFDTSSKGKEYFRIRLEE